MEIEILILITCYILSIISYYLLLKYLYNSEIFDKKTITWMDFYITFIPLMNMLASISFILIIIESTKANKDFLYRFFKIKK